LYIIETAALIAVKFCTAIRPNILYGWLNIRTTNPRRQTAAILKH